MFALVAERVVDMLASIRKVAYVALFATAGVVSMSVSAEAALIKWETAMNISAASDVSTNGSAIFAYRIGGGEKTVNTVTFAAGSYSDGNTVTLGDLTMSTSGDYGSINSYNGYGYGSVTDANYQRLLTYGSGMTQNKAGSTIALTMNNLTMGSTYAVQLWYNDARGDGVGRTEVFSSTDGTTTTSTTLSANVGTAAAPAAGQYVIGTFTADGASQVITAVASINAQVNAIQLRQVPEPSSIALLAVGIAGLLAYAWRKRK